MNKQSRQKKALQNYSVINPVKQATVASLIKKFKPSIVKLRFRAVQCDTACSATRPGSYVTYRTTMLPRYINLLMYDRYFFVMEDSELKLFVTV